MIRNTPYNKLPVANKSLPLVILEPLLSVLRPNWGDCLINIDKISRYFWLMKFGLFVSTFHRLIFMIGRLFIGSVACSVGILFSPPGLSSLLKYLRPIATSIVLFVEDHSPLRIIPLISMPEIKKDIVNSTSWSIIGLVIGGVVTVSLGLGFVHYLLPSLFIKLPVVGTVVGAYAAYINDTAGTIWNLFTSYLPSQGSNSNQGLDTTAAANSSVSVQPSVNTQVPVQPNVASENVVTSPIASESVVARMRMPERIVVNEPSSRADVLRRILETYGPRQSK
uniref:Uncharacterized protein n=1 Tax=Coniophora puteana TaxID=80637 RepID=A0A896Z1M4_9AGAM